MLRDALADILAAEPDIEVIGTASSGEAIIEIVRALAPDVLVLDISMPGITGIEVTQRLREMKASVKVLALSAYGERKFVEAMLKAGAAGYITKASAASDLTNAICDVFAGRTHLSADITDVLLESIVTDARRTEPTAHALGPRERQVLIQIAEGSRSIEIAQRLGIAVATVEVHRRNIMGKLDIHTIAELTRFAVREGLVKA
jgi:DNA-binding NarL/FixJ family response regulator